MPTAVLEKKIESLPQEYVQMVAEYVDYLEYKIKSNQKNNSEFPAEEKIAQAHMNAIWEELKNDTW